MLRTEASGVGRPQVAIGMLCYEEPVSAVRALEALCTQTYADLRVRIFDNSRTPATELALARVVASDERVSFQRNATNIGSYRNYVQAFEWCSAAGEYFAIASDHDVVERDWLARLVDELEAHPEAVTAFPRTRRVDDTGRSVAAPSPRAIDHPSRLRRAAAAMRPGAGCGTIFYGIHRSSLLERIHLHPTVTPDLLFIGEACYHGSIRLVDEPLFTRVDQAERRRAGDLIGRQYDRLAIRRGPIPYWARNTLLLWRGGLPPSAATGPVYGLTIGVLYLRRHAIKSQKRRIRQVRRAVSRGRRILGSVLARARTRSTGNRWG